MHRLVILSCQVFELELAHIISTSGITRIYMEHSPENKKFASLLGDGAVTFLRDISFMPRISKEITLIVNMLPVGLHVDIDELHYEVNSAIDHYNGVANAYLLMYGLCGKALEGIISRNDVTMYYPCDNGVIVDDCVCSLLGKEGYERELVRGGSLFVIPGLAKYHDKISERVAERAGKERNDSMMLMMHQEDNYKRALIVEEGIESPAITECEHRYAKRFELPVEYNCGTLDILRAAFESAVEAVR